MVEKSLAFSQDTLIRADPVTLFNHCFCLPWMRPCIPDLEKTWDVALWRCHGFVMACGGSGSLDAFVLVHFNKKKIQMLCVKLFYHTFAPWKYSHEHGHAAQRLHGTGAYHGCPWKTRTVMGGKKLVVSNFSFTCTKYFWFSSCQLWQSALIHLNPLWGFPS